MKNRLWVFGCSVSDKKQPAELIEYVKWKGYVINTWSEILSKLLDMELMNFGVSGGSNLTILNEFSTASNEIQAKDIVILNWTEITRFRVASDDKWLNVLTYHLFRDELKNELDRLEENFISKKTISEILTNRTKDLYFKELDSWSNLIKEFCVRSDVKILFWGLTDYRDYMVKIENQNLHSFITKRYGRIMEETKGQIYDGHFSELAHKKCAELFYELLK